MGCEASEPLSAATGAVREKWDSSECCEVVLRGQGMSTRLDDMLSSAGVEEMLWDSYLHPHQLFVGLPCTDLLLCPYRVMADTLAVLQLYLNSEGQQHV